MNPLRDFDGSSMDLSDARRRAKVTDHALVRYLERFYGVDVESIRREMLTPVVLQGMALGSTSVSGPGFKLIIDNFSVVTTLEPGAIAAITPARRAKVLRSTVPPVQPKPEEFE